MRRDQQPYELPVTWIPVTNEESEPVPPYGVVEIKSINESTGIAVVGKPSKSGQTNILFNGSSPIVPDGAGQVTSTLPAVAAYQADDGSGSDPVHGDIWGIVADSWYLHKAKPGFRVIGSGGVGACNVELAIGRIVDFVRITSTTKTDDRYPARLTEYDVAAKTWSDVTVDGSTVDVWVIDPNGEDLGLKKGEAVLAGYANGRPVYVASAQLWDTGTC